MLARHDAKTKTNANTKTNAKPKAGKKKGGVKFDWDGDGEADGIRLTDKDDPYDSAYAHTPYELIPYDGTSHSLQ